MREGMSRPDRDYPKFPHLENLNRAPEVLGAASVRISEKIDGFNARFGRTVNGELWAGTRNRVINLETEPTQGFAAFVKGLDQSLIHPGETFFGEWAGKGIQKRIDYGEPDFWLFAILKINGTWGEAWEIVGAARSSSLKFAPTVYEGPPPTLDELTALRDEPGVAGLSEGIVIWPYPMISSPLKGGQPLIAKYKNPEFEERASQRHEPRQPVDLSTVKAFVEEYATEERFINHVLKSLIFDSFYAGHGLPNILDPKHTGTVLQAMYQDVVREGAADYDALSRDDQKAVGRVLNPITKGFLEAARNAAFEEATE